MSVLAPVSVLAIFVVEPVLADVSLVLLVASNPRNQLLVCRIRLEGADRLWRGALRAELGIIGIRHGERVCLSFLHWDERCTACHIGEDW